MYAGHIYMCKHISTQPIQQLVFICIYVCVCILTPPRFNLFNGLPATPGHTASITCLGYIKGVTYIYVYIYIYIYMRLYDYNFHFYT